MSTIEYRVSTLWKDNSTETAHEIISDQIIKLYNQISKKFDFSIPPKATSEVRFNWFGLKKKILTKVEIKYGDPRE
jgi:hypothetical protein